MSLKITKIPTAKFIDLKICSKIEVYDYLGSFFKKPRKGEIYNIGGGRYSNCSVIEALDYVESLLNIKIKKNYQRTNRIGDHIWYISDTRKFKNHYPNWKQEYGTKQIIEELIYSFQ